MIKKNHLIIYFGIAVVGICLGIFFPKKTIKSIFEKIVDTRLQALMQHDFVYASAKIKPSVVGLVVTKVKVVEDHEPYSDYFNQYFVQNGIPSPNYQTVYNMGSGIVIDTNGNILTSNHIVNGAEELTIAFADGSTVGAVVIASDTLSDLAVIRADTLYSTPTPADFVSEDSLQVGEFVLAAGNPFLNFFNSADPTITLGIVSALHRNFRFTGTGIYQDMIQTDAAINPGNSGGPLFNTRGEVCGVNSFIYTGDESVQGSVGIGFAIPASRAYHIAKELITYGRRRVSWTGLKITDQGGIVITAVSTGGPGQVAGIEPGDRIVRIADRKIIKPSDIVGVFLPYFPGDTITFTVSRNGKEKVVELILQEMP